MCFLLCLWDKYYKNYVSVWGKDCSNLSFKSDNLVNIVAVHPFFLSKMTRSTKNEKY